MKTTKILNFSTDAILDSELKPTGNGYTNHKVDKGFVFQWSQKPVPSPWVSAQAREQMTESFLGKYTSLTTYPVGSGWQCTEVVSVSGRGSGIIFSMRINDSSTAKVEAFVKNLRFSSPLSVLSSFAYNMTPQLSVVPQSDGSVHIKAVLSADRGIILDVSNEWTPDGVMVDWKNGLYWVDPERPLSETVIGRAALNLAGLKEQ